MDRIIKTRREKVYSSNDTLELHPKIYIWGKSGIGKTWTVRRSLDKFLELDYEINKFCLVQSIYSVLPIIHRPARFQFPYRSIVIQSKNENIAMLPAFLQEMDMPFMQNIKAPVSKTDG